jgi:hypothetical protein
MIFWSLCAFIWFKNIEKMLLQMTSGFLQLELGLGINSHLHVYALVTKVVDLVFIFF